VTLKDGTQLTLGEHATLVVGEFIYDPSRSRAEPAIRVVKGAFLYVGGLIDKETDAKVRIRTPLAAIGIRGTTVWGSPIDNGYGVIVLSGGGYRNGEKRNCYSETRPGNDALRRPQPSAGCRLAGRPDETRCRLDHLWEALGGQEKLSIGPPVSCGGGSSPKWGGGSSPKW
jgi:hypothetical protein